MDNRCKIEQYLDDLNGLLPFFRMSTGVDAEEGIRHLIAIEVARGTRYDVAIRDDRIVGFIGTWFDPTGLINDLEPPQIIDIAVLPEYRRQGVARALMDQAIHLVQSAGYERLWLYTDGDDAALLTFYRRLGFRLVSVVPGWFANEGAKAILRRDIPGRAD